MMNNYDYAKQVYDFKFKNLRNEPDYMSALKERIIERFKELNELLFVPDCEDCSLAELDLCVADGRCEDYEDSLEFMIHEEQFRHQVYALLKRSCSLTEEQVLALNDDDYEEWREEAFNAEYKALEDELTDVQHLLRWLKENGF
ncbi:hypothetical protein AGMMS50268_07640 [Spirochaetia bacterium]|nr:hypothetical protein AGMMS50268_07640 [Spirochaetia bacterium]